MKNPAEMTEDERFREIARLLARGLLRTRGRGGLQGNVGRSVPHSPLADVPLDLSPHQSVHGPVESTTHGGHR